MPVGRIGSDGEQSDIAAPLHLRFTQKRLPKTMLYERFTLLPVLFTLILVTLAYLLWRPFVTLRRTTKKYKMLEKCTQNKKRIYIDFLLSGTHDKTQVRWFNDFSGAKTVLFCTDVTDNHELIKFTHEAELNLVLFHHRDLRDSAAIYKFISEFECAPAWGTHGPFGWSGDMEPRVWKRQQRSPLVVWGEGLGVATALYIASQCNCDKLILNMCSRLPKYDLRKHLLSPALIDPRLAKRVHCPVLILCSDENERVSATDIQNFLACFGSTDKTLLSIHLESALASIKRFIRK